MGVAACYPHNLFLGGWPPDPECLSSLDRSFRYAACESVMTPDRRCPACQLPLVYVRDDTREDTLRAEEQQAGSEAHPIRWYRCFVHGVWRGYGDGRDRARTRQLVASWT